mmetsp:Transcript_38149/g.123112  ORF Transcript_38149/g.123112 Transcript_38149/m.123112 type:complete len:112 (-) Transcript_38149:106-441(-)
MPPAPTHSAPSSCEACSTSTSCGLTSRPLHRLELSTGEPLRFEWIFTVEELANVTRLLGMEPAVEDALRVHSLPRGNGFHCRAAERRRIEQLYEVDYRAFRLAGVRFRWAS